MSTLPPIINPLRPQVRHSWMPPIRFRTKPYLHLSKSLSDALEELESRYPSHRDQSLLAEAIDDQRAMRSLRRRPR
jgi:hypothetical protein